MGAARHFDIEGLDCAEEVKVLRRELGPLVGEDNLSFQVLDGRLAILAGAAAVPEPAILTAVARTGMKARPWRPEGAEPGEDSFWSRHARTVLCVTSGVLLTAAFIAEAAGNGGLRAALEAGEPRTASILLYLAAVLTGAWFVLPKALYSARTLRPDMNLLMMVAVAGAIGIGEWFEAATVSFLFALALLLERWSVGRARRAIGGLLRLSPEVARVVDPASGESNERPVDRVKVDERIRVRPGDKIPLDAVVLEGESAIDQSAITGESLPVAKAAGDEIFAGTVNGSGTLVARVTHAARDTTLARIVRMVGEAQARKAPSERWVERFARIYTPLMMGLALAIAVLPPLFTGGGWAVWFYRALVLLVIACPCALVISTPVSVVAGLARAARSGVLVKGGRHLEAPARFRAIAFDKTGTLTHGLPVVHDVRTLDDHSDDEVLANAAAIEADSSHPLARAVVDAAHQRGLRPGRAQGVRSLPGKGAEGRVEGHVFWVGSHRLMEEKGAETPEFHRLALELEDAGHSLVAVGTDDHVCGLIAISDGVREEAAMALAELRALGIDDLVMLTGDNERAARAVATEIGLARYHAELLPEEKVAAVESLRRECGAVAMIGDGINDAPALAVATTGIAMGAAGSDAAIETADVALMSDELLRLPWLIRHSRRVLTVIRQNIFFALAVKAAFVALAAMGLATLWMAIAADMGASLLVVANGLRLLR